MQVNLSPSIVRLIPCFDNASSFTNFHRKSPVQCNKARVGTVGMLSCEAVFSKVMGGGLKSSIALYKLNMLLGERETRHTTEFRPL